MPNTKGQLVMTPEQRHLARHALGLPTDRKRSFRNRYFSYPGTPHDADWLAMVAAGEAEVELASDSGEKMNFFCLTRKGAEAALERGEKLCPEDFPAPVGA